MINLNSRNLNTRNLQTRLANKHEYDLIYMMGFDIWSKDSTEIYLKECRESSGGVGEAKRCRGILHGKLCCFRRI